MAEPKVRLAPTRTRRSLPRIPIQAVTLVGLTGGCYAVSLAVVAGLQSGADRTAAAVRAPISDAAGSIVAGNDRLSRDLLTLGDIDRQGVDANAALASGISDLEHRIDGLSATVGRVDGATRGLPARVPMPPSVRSVRVTAASGPAHVVTGGSAPP